MWLFKNQKGKMMSNSIITPKMVKNIIGRRNKEIHKGDCGKILIAAGSTGMAGAAILSSTAALRAGAGLVRLAIPQELFPIVQIGIPEATCIPRDLSNMDLPGFDAACVGPGLGEDEESISFVRNILKSFRGPLVLDADGLNIVAHNDLFDLLRERKDRFMGQVIITPHIGEARRLLGMEFDKITEKTVKGEEKADLNNSQTRFALATALSQKTRAITILKGAGTVVATESGETYTNTTGNPGLATGGSGDVLSGIIAGMLGQKALLRDLDGLNKSSALACTICSVYIHGLAGDLAAAEMGEYGLIAGDIAKYTAFAIKKILEES